VPLGERSLSVEIASKRRVILPGTWVESASSLSSEGQGHHFQFLVRQLFVQKATDEEDRWSWNCVVVDSKDVASNL